VRNLAKPADRKFSMSASPDYRTRIVSDLSTIGSAAWDALAGCGGSGPERTEGMPSEANPFLRYAFLHALHETGCAARETGWEPAYLTLWRGKHLAGAVPLYRKTQSYGEYVFDWAWADAYQRNGLAYYPKLLSAIPFTPVTGPRLLAIDSEARSALIAALLNHAKASGLSSLHVLYPEDDEADALHAAGMMLRHGVQFHWENPGYADFEAFLETLERKKRKNIRAERRKVAEAGIRLRQVRGADVTEADWRFFARCYAHTYRAHHSSPYLNLEFFRRIGRDMPENILLIIAERPAAASEGMTPIASSLVIHTASTLYGRYWGEVEHVPCLHFECAYYQPLEFCISNGLRYFEGGAQGEHKMARGFLPVRTRSAHWLAHPAFADAVQNFLERESAGIGAYMDELHEHDPFKGRPGAVK